MSENIPFTGTPLTGGFQTPNQQRYFDQQGPPGAVRFPQKFMVGGQRPQHRRGSVTIAVADSTVSPEKARKPFSNSVSSDPIIGTLNQSPQQHDQIITRPHPQPSPSIKRPAPSIVERNRNEISNSKVQFISPKKIKLGDKMLSHQVLNMFPESRTYMGYLDLERRFDAIIMRKRLEFERRLKRPLKVKKKFRIGISHKVYPVNPYGMSACSTAYWEMKINGGLLEDDKKDGNLMKRRFSTFLKWCTICLDRNIYGPDECDIKWKRSSSTDEFDAFHVRRPGDKDVRCSIRLFFDHQSSYFKLDPRLARLLGIHTQSKEVIIEALWQYIKKHRLQDAYETHFFNCDKYLKQIFGIPRMKLVEIPLHLCKFLHQPDEIILPYTISSEGTSQRVTTFFDISVEVDDIISTHMKNFLASPIYKMETTLCDRSLQVITRRVRFAEMCREFYLNFSKDSKQCVQKWIISQNKDLKTMTDIVGCPEEERRAEYYYEPWIQEAVSRYSFNKYQQENSQLDQAWKTKSNTVPHDEVFVNESKQ